MVVVVVVMVVVVVVRVMEEGAGGAEGVKSGGASEDAKDMSVQEREGEVTVMLAEDVMLSDKDKNGVETWGVKLDSGRVVWAGFDSSHRPFLQQEDSRKSNRQEETLSTRTIAIGLQTHADNSKGHAHSTESRNAYVGWHGDVDYLVALSICSTTWYTKKISQLAGLT